MVRVQREALAALAVRRLRLVIGGSLGGMQVLEWAATFPGMVGTATVIAAPGRHPARIARDRFLVAGDCTGHVAGLRPGDREVEERLDHPGFRPQG